MFQIDPNLTLPFSATSKLLILVRPERFELPTLWFEAKCSIQLSYGRENKTIQTPKLADIPPHGNYVVATGSGGGGVTNIGILSTISNPARRRSS